MLEAIRKNVSWRVIPIAGLAAGTVFLLTNFLLNPSVLGVDVTLLLRYFAALVMGDDVLVGGDATTVIVGILVHYALSILFALVIAIVVHRWGMLVGIIGGAILGLAIYGINLYTMTRFVEWFFAINSSILLLSHVLFGAVAGAVYELFDHYDEPFFKEGAEENATA